MQNVWTCFISKLGITQAATLDLRLRQEMSNLRSASSVTGNLHNCLLRELGPVHSCLLRFSA